MRFEKLTNAIKKSVKLCDEITRLNLVLVSQGTPSSELTSPDLASSHENMLEDAILKSAYDQIIS
jgi:hypothetical protein